MYTIIRRFFEMLGMCVLFSAIIGIMVYFGFISGNMWGKTKFFVIGAAILFVILNFISLRQSYVFVSNNALYYIFNFIAWLMFATANIVCYKLASGFVYGISFGITKVVSTAFFPDGTVFGNILSAVIFHFVLVVSMLLAPIGMKWVFLEEAEEDIDDEAYMEDEYYIEDEYI